MSDEIAKAYPNSKQAWSLIGVFILTLILFVPIYLFADKIAGKELSTLIYYLLTMGSLFWIAHIKRKTYTNASEYNFEFSSPAIIALTSITTIAIQIGLIYPIVSSLPMPEFVKKIFLELSERQGLFSFLAIVIAAPILEELVFRGIILDGFLKKYSPVKSILLSSIIFGVFHLNPWQFITALITGIFSGWVYYKTKKITTSILIHFTNNLLAFVFMYFMDPKRMLDQTITTFYGGVLNTLAITLGAILVGAICLYYLREIFQTERAL
ncbi:MAG: type II CAAX endopeptidase family protein [Chryseolinea sp.]